MGDATLSEMKDTETKKNVTGGSGKGGPQSSPSVARLFSKPSNFSPQNAPVRYDPSSAPATLHMVRMAMNEVMKEWETKIEAKTKYCEEAKAVVAQTLEQVRLYSPEEVAVLEAENARHLAEIKNLQFAIHLSRKTNRELGVQGGARFWRRLGADFIKDAALIQQYSQEVAEYTSGLVFEGQEVLSNLLNHLDSMAQSLEAYGQNAESYAFDHAVGEQVEDV